MSNAEWTSFIKGQAAQELLGLLGGGLVGPLGGRTAAEVAELVNRANFNARSLYDAAYADDRKIDLDAKRRLLTLQLEMLMGQQFGDPKMADPLMEAFLAHRIRYLTRNARSLSDEDYERSAHDIALGLEQLFGVTQAAGSADSPWQDIDALARFLAERAGRPLKEEPTEEAPPQDEPPDDEPAPTGEGEEVLPARFQFTATAANTEFSFWQDYRSRHLCPNDESGSTLCDWISMDSTHPEHPVAPEVNLDITVDRRSGEVIGGFSVEARDDRKWSGQPELPELDRVSLSAKPLTSQPVEVSGSSTEGYTWSFSAEVEFTLILHTERECCRPTDEGSCRYVYANDEVTTFRGELLLAVVREPASQGGAAAATFYVSGDYSPTNDYTEDKMQTYLTNAGDVPIPVRQWYGE